MDEDIIHLNILKIQKLNFYLKDQKMTIAGVKLILNSNIKKLDEHKQNSLKEIIIKIF